MSLDSAIKSYEKTPQEILDYSVTWADELTADGDTISTSTFTADTGINIDSQFNDPTVGTVWLSGGTAGQDYAVSNQILTAAGRVRRRSFIVRVRNL